MAIAGAATALPRWETLLFTGGIGERAPAVYGEICRRLTGLRRRASGTSAPALSSATAEAATAGARELTATGLRVLIVPADEAAVMDRETRAPLVSRGGAAGEFGVDHTY